MTKIVPNDLLNPTEKTIKNWNCSFIAVEGPNILDKLSLEDLAIPYESQYRSRIILKAGETDQPLIYGFIGKAVTFLMIKVTYDSADPYYQYEQEKYNITYYFENDPILRPLNRLMVMTGSADEKIPQIYLNNPLDYDVVLDVMHATTDSDFGTGITIGFGMSNLSDVVFSGLTSGDIITYDGTTWHNVVSNPIVPTYGLKTYISADRSNSSSFYFNSILKTSDSSTSSGYESAFMVNNSGFTTVNIYLRQTGSPSNNTIISLYSSTNGNSFSSSSLIVSDTKMITLDTITLYSFTGLTINQYDSLFIYCQPTFSGIFYGEITVE